MNFLLNILLQMDAVSGAIPYLIILTILIICGLGLPVPEDITLFASGIMAYYGMTNVWLTIAIAYAGVIIGDSIIFYIGSTRGRSITRNSVFKRLITDQKLALMEKKIADHGPKIILAARFMPGLRAPIYLTSGILKFPYRIFILFDGIAALVSVPLIVWTVYYFGEHVDHVIKIIRNVQYGILYVIVFIVAIIMIRYYHKKRKAEAADLARRD